MAIPAQTDIPAAKSPLDTISDESVETESNCKYYDAKLLREADVMCDYAMANGLAVPATLLKNRAILVAKAKDGLTVDEIGELASIHQQVNRIVAPATPQALLLMETERQKSNMFSFIGVVPIIRHIMLVSVLFLISFILIGQLEVVDDKNLQRGILGSSGWEAVAVLGYLVSCAGLGACFTSLYRLNNYISDATYDPRYDSTYWASILLGVIAGLFISELLHATFFAGSENGSDSVTSLGKPALALLGGFSANMVYKILQRMVDSIESLFKGDQKSMAKANRNMDLSQLKQKQDEIHMNVASRLLSLDELMKSDPNGARSEIRSAIDDLLVKK